VCGVWIINRINCLGVLLQRALLSHGGHLLWQAASDRPGLYTWAFSQDQLRPHGQRCRTVPRHRPIPTPVLQISGVSAALEFLVYCVNGFEYLVYCANGFEYLVYFVNGFEYLVYCVNDLEYLVHRVSGFQAKFIQSIQNLKLFWK